MIINLNDTVKFKLSKSGAETWNARYDDLILDKYPEPLPVGAEVKAPLWEFMRVFGGRRMYMGMPGVPTVGNTVELVKSVT
jgi:hypothetical protein